MSLPVSQYEALLAEVRDLRKKAQRVQQLARPLIGSADYAQSPTSPQNEEINEPHNYTMDSLLMDRQVNPAQSPNYERVATSSAEGETTGSDDDCAGGIKGNSTHMSVSSEPVSHRNRSALYHGTWPVERTMWNSEPTSLGTQSTIHNGMDVTSVMSFASSSGGVPLDRVLDSPNRSRRSSQHLEAKVEMVYSLLAVLGGQEHADMGETLLALSTNPESCLAMRQSGCIPLLVQLVQSEKDVETMKKASLALHNLVHSQTDDKIRKRETRILKLLEQTRAYTYALRTNTEYQPESSSSTTEDGDKHPIQIIAHIMKLSFDEGHRQAICQLGGIHAIATLVEAEHSRHGSTTNENNCILMRRYACMALTNLTFGDSGNKALLCSFREFMRALVVQLQSPSDELRQVTASVLRNLSWRADSTSKDILREVGSVTGLMKAAMLDNKENTLKSILSALWNLSAHCSENKSEICAVEGALGFLVDMLTYKTPSKSLAIIENSGGILRNISSQIAVREDYREILRKHNCLQILLDQLKSPSLTIVSNACGTLWNLSAKCITDQDTLWKLGAPSMLRSLNHSKHKMISMGSSAALKNLLSSRPQHALVPQMDATAMALDLPVLPTLGARKQKALLQDLDNNLSETYENIEKDSPVKSTKPEKYIPTNDFIQKPQKRMNKSSSPPSDLVYETKTRSNPNIVDSDHLSNSFASLNINEPSTSYTSDLRPKSKIPQSYGSTSLPYMAPVVKRVPAPCTYIPVRNKFSDCAYDDEIEVSDQPIDYSQKYSETKVPIPDSNKIPSKKGEEGFSFPKPSPEDESFGIYAETDLDQPTDYSLRYAEDDSDLDICSKIKSEGTGFIQDTVKTYCTEGTPYETPFNFSTATSMSDLRIEDKPVIDNDKLTIKIKSKEIKTEDEKEHCSTEDISDTESPPKPSDKIPKSEFSSGLLSPEKPVNYCDEGTPGYFSRVSSFGSIPSIPPNETIKEESKINLSIESQRSHEKTVIEKVPQKSPAEAKAVKFEQVVNYAEETPLMFSRSSSLASLDSIEQHSIHDDRSSVVSDFSRLTSGIVSPSELPDSPTQTVPPSPKPRKLPLEFPFAGKARPNEQRPQPAPRSLPKPSVFEDNLTKFKEESTPIQFSTATSLSSLNIDDHDDSQPETIQQAQSGSSRDNGSLKEEHAEKQDAEKESNISDVNDDLAQESDDDEDILAACINIGMQNNRHNNKAKSPSPSPSKLPMSSFKYQSKPQINAHSSGIPLPKTLSRTLPTTNNIHSPNLPSVDTVRTYCTEDTPAALSHAGSNSDLSLLSIPNDSKSKKDYLSDDSSNLSGDNDNILAECIQSGMPKARKEILKPTIVKPVSCLPRRNIATSTPLKYPPEGSNLRRECADEAHKVQNKDANRKTDTSLPPYLAAKDEVESYVVENSPCQFSLRSSLSDLTVDGSVAGLKKYTPNNNNNSQLSSFQDTPSSSGLQETGKLNISQEHNVSLKESSRRESLSSISVESLGSLEAEQALLEQCISSGMPKSNAISIPPNKPLEVTKPIAIPTASGKPKQMPVDVPDLERKPKNVNVASVAKNTGEQVNEVPAETMPAAADVEENPKIGTGSETGFSLNSGTAGTVSGTSLDKCMPLEENLLTGLKKSGSNKSLGQILDPYDLSPEYSYSISDNCAAFDVKDDMESCLARSCEESGKIVDNRMLDPDAMIESLDRFTAELVSQASHLNKDDDKYKISTSDNTWNDDTSPNEITFPSISGSAPNVITFKSDDENSNKVDSDVIDGLQEQEQQSNDFSSVNTSTMTESTLIAFEAGRMVTVFKNEAEMSQSISSVASLELDKMQPPSNMNSLTNSAIGMERIVPKSPKLVTRKKSLPAEMLVRRALSNSLQHGSSIESLDNNSLSNLDHMNPPSDIRDVFDMEASMSSIASLPHETSEFKADFVINGILSKEKNTHDHNPIFNIRQPGHGLQYMGSSIYDLDHINPPSLFNEITDMCNSLADVPTEAICSETEIFEDCVTHIAETLNDDVTEFSDANSVTPIQSDVCSSSDSTPKRSKGLSKSMISKQKRNLARERYKTYTVAAEMIMNEQEKSKDQLSRSVNSPEDFKTVDCITEDYQSIEDDTTYVSPTYSVSSSKLTPRERRRANKSRFETQTLDEAITSVLKQPVIDSSPADNQNQETDSNSSSANQSPVRTKLSIRRNFMQKRLENKERFRTQTLSESSFSPEILSASPTNGETDLHLLVQQEANLVLKSLNETKTNVDELLDCETVSLVSNDDDSEHNSGCSINYRTYHKSWGVRKNNNVPIVNQSNLVQDDNDLVNCPSSNLSNDQDSLPTTNDEPSENSEEEEIQEEIRIIAKPKIVKPSERQVINEDIVNEEQVKTIRGRRKPLFSKANINNKISPKNLKPVKNMTSNLVKNVTSSLKSGTSLKSVVSKQNKSVLAKPPVSQSRISSGYGSRPNSNSPKTSPARTVSNKNSRKHVATPQKPSTPKTMPPLDRQGTFTKEESSTPVTPKSKIPAPTSKIPSLNSKIARPLPPTASKIPGNANRTITSYRNGVKSASSDRTIRNSKIYNRSTSADSRDTSVRKIQSSSSSQSLKSDVSKTLNGAVKKSGIPSAAERSNSNTSLNSNGSAKKQVTSKIASLWKKIEESKNKAPKNDSRVWIQAEPEPEPPRLIRSNTFDNKDQVILRNKPPVDNSDVKRVSRLGSFIVMDENEDGVRLQQAICTANV